MKIVNIHEARKLLAIWPVAKKCRKDFSWVYDHDWEVNVNIHIEWEYKPSTLICVHSAGRWVLRNTWFVSPLFCTHTVNFFLPPNSTFPKSVSLGTWMPFLFFWRSSRNVDLRGLEKAETLKQDKSWYIVVKACWQIHVHVLIFCSFF